MAGATDSPTAAAELLGTLRADCSRCAGLCCVVPGFTASADFAIDKQPREPCPNLQPDFRCAVHTRLRQQGFPGCAAYDCFGAGQHVTQVVFGGRDWRRSPLLADQMFDVFVVVRQLHELVRYQAEALTLPGVEPLRHELATALADTLRTAEGGPESLLATDVTGLRERCAALLRRASELVRRGMADDPADHSGADLVGARLAGADLRAASLRGARLVGADLSRADLRGADLTGTDLRGADLRGADLSGCLFLTQPQLDAANGDATTRLPRSLDRPRHWG